MKDIKLQLDNIFMKYGLSPEIEMKKVEGGYSIECVQKGFCDVSDRALIVVSCFIRYDFLSGILYNKDTFICDLYLDFAIDVGRKHEYTVSEVLKFNRNHSNVEFFYESDRDLLALEDEFKNIGTSQVAYYLDILLSRIYNKDVREFLTLLYINSSLLSVLS